MKKIFYIVVILLGMTLCGCSQEEQIGNFDYDIYEWSGIGYMEDSYSNCEDSIVLLRDYAAYQEYINSLPTEISNKELSLELLSYDMDFFEENMLIFIIHWESTGSSTITLSDIVYEQSNIRVILKSIFPSGGHDDMMKDYGIIVRIPQDDKYTTISHSIIKEYEKSGMSFNAQKLV